MPVINRIAAFAEEMKGWRRHLHQYPELLFDLPETAAFVKARLEEIGVDEIHDGIAQTGMVAIINGQGAGPTIGLRADMDALPIMEATGAEHASKVPGKMHACGHDGHTTMLLGAAKYLAETRNFSGRVALIFQPAEEGGGGAGVMVREGILDRFDIAQVYGIHNKPNMPAGMFIGNHGNFLAAADTFTVRVTGVGGHGAHPEDCVDPIVAAVAVVNGFQTISSRNHDNRKELVVSVTQFHAGTADNVIPGEATLNGTVRTYDKAVQDMVMARMQAIVDGVSQSYGVKAELHYEKGYPATVNDPEKAEFALSVAQELVGADRVDAEMMPEMGAEDFSYMLEERPGAYIYLGAGPGADWHHAEYDFNDEISPIGASYFVRLVETAQPVG